MWWLIRTDPVTRVSQTLGATPERSWTVPELSRHTGVSESLLYPILERMEREGGTYIHDR
jgi:hypothetical protein